MNKPKGPAKKALLLFLTFAISLHCAGCAAAPALGMIVGNLLSIGVKFAAMKFAEKSFKKGDSTAGWAAMMAGSAIAPAMGRLGHDVIGGLGNAWDRSRADARGRRQRDEAYRDSKRKLELYREYGKIKKDLDESSWRDECVCEGATRSADETSESHPTDFPSEVNVKDLDPKESQPAKDEQTDFDNSQNQTPVVTEI